MGSSIGYGPGIAVWQYLVCYDRGVQENASWRGYYDSFDTLDDAQKRYDEAVTDGYAVTIFDVLNGTMIKHHDVTRAFLSDVSTLATTDVGVRGRR